MVMERCFIRFGLFLKVVGSKGDRGDTGDKGVQGDPGVPGPPTLGKDVSENELHET